MAKTLSFLFLLTGLVYAGTCVSQVFPKEGSSLNYRIIGFSFPSTKQSNYKLEIATGNYNNEDSFQRHISMTLNLSMNKAIAEVPTFGTMYTWRIIYKSGANAMHNKLHHFSTSITQEVDTNFSSLNILVPTKKYKDLYVFVDAAKALYDMDGNPVWYLPKVDSTLPTVYYARDLKATSSGAITFIMAKGIYELDYDGNILWKMPQNSKGRDDSIEFFHHEFTRLSNGHYMALGDDTVSWMPGKGGDSSFVIVDHGNHATDSNVDEQKMHFGTIIEYDEKGHVVWNWHSLDYFKQSDLYYWHGDGGLNARVVDVHMNSFFYDQQEHAIYVSFKGIDRIIKVSYPDGMVLRSYGPVLKPYATECSDLVFCGQHCVNIASNGDVFLYNNNVCTENGIPTIEELRQPVSDTETRLEKVWEYMCPMDTEMINKRIPNRAGRYMVGGSEVELPDSSFLICAPSMATKLFVVNRNKQIVWSAIWKKRNPKDGSLIKAASYRANIIDRGELEKLIWSSEEHRTKK